jgi:nicotinate-nucleotide pyrophosphorylase (carboxylating)
LSRNYLKAKNLDLRIEVETKTLNEVKQALELKVDRIMLDNMNLEQIKQATQLISEKIETEISGGINLESVADYYNSEVDYISVGQLTHSAIAFDYSLLVD